MTPWRRKESRDKGTKPPSLVKERNLVTVGTVNWELWSKSELLKLKYAPESPEGL